MRKAGFSVKTVAEAGLQGRPDELVLQAAATGGFSILTQDLDFGRIFVERSPPVQIVVLRSKDPRSDSLRRIVDAMMKKVDLDAPQHRAALIVVGEHGYRVRARSL